MWRSLKEWGELQKSWIDGEFNKIDTEEIKKKADFYTNIVNKCIKLLPKNPISDKLSE